MARVTVEEIDTLEFFNCSIRSFIQNSLAETSFLLET